MHHAVPSVRLGIKVCTVHLGSVNCDVCLSKRLVAALGKPKLGCEDCQKVARLLKRTVASIVSKSLMTTICIYQCTCCCGWQGRNKKGASTNHAQML